MADIEKRLRLEDMFSDDEDTLAPVGWGRAAPLQHVRSDDAPDPGSEERVWWAELGALFSDDVAGSDREPHSPGATSPAPA